MTTMEARFLSSRCPRCGQLLQLTDGGAYCANMRCAYARGTMPKPALGELYALGNIPWGRLADRHRSSHNRDTERSRWAK